MTEYEYDSDRAHAELLRVARSQRWLIASVVGQVAVWFVWLVLAVATDGRSSDNFESFAIRLTVVLGVGGGFCGLLIYCATDRAFTGFMLFLASIPPFLGLFALLVSNRKASERLKAENIAVGVFGADLTTIGHPFGYYDLYEGDAGW